jgi:hypothetical protein
VAALRAAVWRTLRCGLSDLAILVGLKRAGFEMQRKGIK